MKKLFIVTSLLIAINVSAQTAPVDIEFILDASGSMAATGGTESQMDISIKSKKEGSCKDTELLVPFKPLDVASFSTLVDEIKPNGYTPIAYSLKTAAGDFVGKG